jgi:hypothetical protein
MLPLEGFESFNDGVFAEKLELLIFRNVDLQSKRQNHLLLPSVIPRIAQRKLVS